FGLRTDFRGELFDGSSELPATADNLREIRTICPCGRKATMLVRQTADGRVLTEGEQVSIEKSVYVSLCRRHWEELTGRWPLTSPKAAKPVARAKVAKKKAAPRKGKTFLKVAAAARPRPPRRTR